MTADPRYVCSSVRLSLINRGIRMRAVLAARSVLLQWLANCKHRTFYFSPSKSMSREFHKKNFILMQTNHTNNNR